MTDISNLTEADFDNMSDEDFLQNFEPVVADEEEMSPAPEAPAEVAVEPSPAPEAAAETAPEQSGGTPAATGAEQAAAEEDHTTPQHTAEEGTPTGEAPAEAVAPVAAEAPNYEELYKQLMKPFKANGKEFAPSNPDEAIRLMQMGANYTKKMQALQPNLKLMRMLENNSLLDESKLAYLIDLDQKNPQAIQKLLHDSKIDPLDLDLSAEPAYAPGNHAVSDSEMAFHDTLANVMMTSTGKDTVSHINSQWDQESKQAIYREPALLSIIDEQRANGIYDRISAEVERQRVLGAPLPVSFLQAYKEVGDRLHQAGQLVPAGSQEVSPTPVTPAPVPAAPVVLDTRPALPKAPAANGNQARAISPAPRSKPAPAAAFDPFNLTDEQVMAIKSLPV
jgi:hypothetical protein